MGEADVHVHAAADCSSLTIVSRRALCEGCRYNRGTKYTPVCNGPLLNGAGIAPCTLARMFRDPAATCWSDDPDLRARWKEAALDDEDDADCGGPRRDWGGEEAGGSGEGVIVRPPARLIVTPRRHFMRDEPTVIFVYERKPENDKSRPGIS